MRVSLSPIPCFSLYFVISIKRVWHWNVAQVGNLTLSMSCLHNILPPFCSLQNIAIRVPSVFQKSKISQKIISGNIIRKMETNSVPCPTKVTKIKEYQKFHQLDKAKKGGELIYPCMISKIKRFYVNPFETQRPNTLEITKNVNSSSQKMQTI